MPEIPAALRREYREQLADLEDRLLAMGGSVLASLDEAVLALETADRERAAAVLRTDERLDARSRTLQDDILRLLALQAPVASELRHVASFFHVNAHLERMSDLCANVARVAQENRPAGGDPQLRAQISEMARQARRVIEGALDAFRGRDVEAARRLPAIDDPLDRLYAASFRRIAELSLAREELDWAMRLLMVARHLERVADHAVDIGEQTIYAVTGEFERLA